MSSNLDKYHDKVEQIEGHVRALRMRLDAGPTARVSEHARAIAMCCWDLLEYTAEDVGVATYKAENRAAARSGGDL
jgi:hypothetical protein